MIRCVIIDDELPARELVRMHLSNLKGYELVSSFDNAIAGFNFLQTNDVDLVFLDIEMPKYSGLQLIRSLKVCPKVILTTAYREYAIEAFELDVLDYLVKPITQERFLKAVSKFNYHNTGQLEKSRHSAFDTAYIFLKVGKTQLKVFLKDILYIEGLKDYIKVHTDETVLVALERLSYMEEKLPEDKFVRIHKSFIVAVDKVNSVHSERIGIKNLSLPIGRVYKNSCLKNILSSRQASGSPMALLNTQLPIKENLRF
jgi:DNA-binding LytR/AlgR family response regulator